MDGNGRPTSCLTVINSAVPNGTPLFNITLAANQVPVADAGGTFNGTINEIHFLYADSVILDGTMSSDSDMIDSYG